MPKASAPQKLLLSIVLALTVHTAAQSQQLDIERRRGTFTPGELALLPEYCDSIQGTRNYSGARGDYWRRVIGEELKHMHHYCRGLRDALFARMATATPAQRDFLWSRAITEYSYIIRASRPGMVLLPEVHFRTGEAYMNLHKYSEAESAFSMARELKPDYVPAYTIWADKLIELKLYARAQNLLQDGLKHSPDSQQLRDRLKKLPGSPEPQKPANAPAESPVQSAPAESPAPSTATETPAAEAAPAPAPAPAPAESTTPAAPN